MSVGNSPLKHLVLLNNCPVLCLCVPDAEFPFANTLLCKRDDAKLVSMCEVGI